VGEVDEYPQAVHLGDDRAASVGESTVSGVIGRRICPGRVRVVGQRQVSDAETGEHPQHGHRIVAETVSALRPDQRGDPSRRPSRADIVAGAGEGEVIGVLRDEPVDAVDLLQRRSDGLVTLLSDRYVYRPELCPDTTAP